MVEFAEHFWGEKQNGFNVLYQNMKHGQVSVKELNEFVKERTLTEDEYQKHFAKILKQVANFGSVGTFSFFWALVKGSLEKLAQFHGQFLQQLHEISKEVQKYADEQQKSHKSVRENESKTLEAVNLMQTTTTCLQKAKENYTARCMEHEKLKRENSPQKEIAKSENRVKKSADEYKMYVEKYAKVRDNYELKMTSASKNFQEFETSHLNQMKKLIIAFAECVENFQYSLYLSSTEFHSQLTNVNVEEILADFVEKKGTGVERPSVSTFEEFDMNSVPPAGAVQSTLTDVDQQLMSLDDNVAVPTVAPSTMSAAAAATLDDLSFFDKGTEATSNGPSNNTLQQPTSNRKIPLWLPGRKAKPMNGPKLPTPTPSPSGDFGSTGSSTEGGGFIRKMIKDKKKKEPDSKSELSNEDAKSQGSGGTQNPPTTYVDAEGFTVRLDEPKASNKHENNESSSDEDSDSDVRPKLNIRIKQPGEESKSASVDELKDAFRDANLFNPSSGFGGSHLKMCRDNSLDDFDPMKTNWYAKPTGGGARELLRPAKTGDDRYNTRSFAGGIGYHHATTGGGGAWSRDENGDTLGDLASKQQMASSTSMARSRPRSTTPTQFVADALVVRSSSLHNAGSATNVWSQAAALNKTADSSSEPSSSFVAFGRSVPAPLAVALTETAHVLFKDNDNISGSTIKIYGSLAISFPAAVVHALANDEDVQPLIVKLINAEKIQSLVPNRQVLSNESSFKADSSHEFVFNMSSLVAQLKQRVASAPASPFFNLDVLRYEVRAEPNGNSAPLTLKSFWKCQPSETDIIVRYDYNSSCPLSAPLLNLTFSTQVNGEVTQAQLKPEGTWNSETSRLEWKLTELSRHSESSGSLKARLTVVGGPSTPVSTSVNFQLNDVCLSGADVLVTSAGYKISLLKKKVVAGRYLCEPEQR